jgi:hypothetical protein
MKDLFGYECNEEGPAEILPRSPLVLTEPKPRGKHYVEPRGYAAMPGTGPEGKTCRDCAHYCRRPNVAGNYSKCGLNYARWTGGRGSDILARSPACHRFNESDGGVMDGTNRTTSGAIGQP